MHAQPQWGWTFSSLRTSAELACTEELIISLSPLLHLNSCVTFNDRSIPLAKQTGTYTVLYVAVQKVMDNLALTTGDLRMHDMYKLTEENKI